MRFWLNELPTSCHSQSMWAERERSVSGAWAERERSVSGWAWAALVQWTPNELSQSEHVSGAWAAKKPLRAPTYFCNSRSPLRSRSVTSRSALRSIVFLQRLLTAPPDFWPAPLRQCSEYPELTVGKLIARFIVKICNDKNLFNKFRPM